MIDNPLIKVLRTANGVLASARNVGIAASLATSSCHWMPMTIAPTYLEKGAAVFAGDSGAGVVYSMADKFGAVNGLWPLPEYSSSLILKRIWFSALPCFIVNMGKGWRLQYKHEARLGGLGLLVVSLRAGNSFRQDTGNSLSLSSQRKLYDGLHGIWPKVLHDVTAYFKPPAALCKAGIGVAFWLFWLIFGQCVKVEEYEK